VLLIALPHFNRSREKKGGEKVRDFVGRVRLGVEVAALSQMKEKGKERREERSRFRSVNASLGGKKKGRRRPRAPARAHASVKEKRKGRGKKRHLAASIEGGCSQTCSPQAAGIREEKKKEKKKEEGGGGGKRRRRQRVEEAIGVLAHLEKRRERKRESARPSRTPPADISPLLGKKEKGYSIPCSSSFI